MIWSFVVASEKFIVCSSSEGDRLMKKRSNLYQLFKWSITSYPQVELSVKSQPGCHVFIQEK